MNVVEARQLSKAFGDVAAVDDVSFTVQNGEVVGLLGANGAGKTTTMRMLLGLILPISGEVTVAGTPVGSLDRRTMGYLPQGLGLYRDLTVAENVGFVAAAFGVAPPSLEAAGLADIADRRVAEVPLGLRRRVAFLVAVCHQPQVLVLDEPTSGVGPLGRARLWEAIREAAGAGAGIVVSTHYMEEAEECDRVLLLSGGREVVSGTVEDIVDGVTAVLIEGDLGEDVLRAVAARGGTALLTRSGNRVVGLSVDDVREIVGDEKVSEVPATFEEAFVTLSA